MSDPKDTKVPYFKNDPWVYVPFFLILAGILYFTATHRVSVEMAAILVGLLGFPSVAGTKTLTGLIAIMVKEAQKQLADSMPPPPMPPGEESIDVVIVHQQTNAIPPPKEGTLLPPVKKDDDTSPGGL